MLNCGQTVVPQAVEKEKTAILRLNLAHTQLPTAFLVFDVALVLIVIFAPNPWSWIAFALMFIPIIFVIFIRPKMLITNFDARSTRPFRTMRKAFRPNTNVSIVNDAVVDKAYLFLNDGWVAGAATRISATISYLDTKTNTIIGSEVVRALNEWQEKIQRPMRSSGQGASIICESSFLWPGSPYYPPNVEKGEAVLYVQASVRGHREIFEAARQGTLHTIWTFTIMDEASTPERETIYPLLVLP